MTDEAIAVYDSLTPEYHRAFEIFLNHTDQKLKAQQWLNDLVDRLPCKDIFIDAGAGNDTWPLRILALAVFGMLVWRIAIHAMTRKLID
jgi:hypothetical protein